MFNKRCSSIALSIHKYCKIIAPHAGQALGDKAAQHASGYYLFSQAETVLLFVNTLAEVNKLAPQAIKAVKPGGMLWIAYAKGTSQVKTDVNRDKLWKAMEPSGWQPVRLIALDDVWSAMRFKPLEK